MIYVGAAILWIALVVAMVDQGRGIRTWLRNTRLAFGRALIGKHRHGASWQEGYRVGYQHGCRDTDPLH